jgi:plasmid segregation protein ParM
MESQARIVSNDIGNGFVKSKSSSATAVFPSVIATEQGALSFDGFNSGDDFVIEFESNRYAVGETAWKLGRMRTTAMDRSRVESDFYRILFAASLVAVVRKSGPLSVIISLPITWYSSRAIMKKRLAGEYVVYFNGKRFVYEIAETDMRIVPEGFGTLAGLILDKDAPLEVKPLMRGRVGVVDIGTKTTDFILFDELELIPAKSGGIDSALSDVWRSVREEIGKIYGRTLELHEVDRAITSGHFMQKGKQENIAALRDRALHALASAVAGEIVSLWSGGNEVDAIVLTGGGAPLIRPYLQFGHEYLVDHGHMANCRGAYLFALHKATKENHR